MFFTDHKMIGPPGRPGPKGAVGYPGPRGDKGTYSIYEHDHMKCFCKYFGTFLDITAERKVDPTSQSKVNPKYSLHF